MKYEYRTYVIKIVTKKSSSELLNRLMDDFVDDWQLFNSNTTSDHIVYIIRKEIK